TAVGNSSGKYSGNQPKNSVVTSPCAKTAGRNAGCSGLSNPKMPHVSAADPRLIRKYVVRRPTTSARCAPKKLPSTAPNAQYPCVAALYPGCAAPPTWSAHGIIHLLDAHAPM